MAPFYKPHGLLSVFHCNYSSILYRLRSFLTILTFKFGSQVIFDQYLALSRKWYNTER